MSQDNHITLRGYLTMEPKLYQKTAAATPITEIRVGSTPRRLNRETGEWYDAPASYYTVKCWRRLAINAASSLHKGDMVVVRGRFYMSHWVDSQQRPQSRLEIEADSLGHDLSYGWSHFLRGTRSQSDRATGVNTGEAARQDVGSASPDAESAGAGIVDDDYSADYSADGGLDQSGEGEITFTPGDPTDPTDPMEPKFTDDTFAGGSVSEAASALKITESDGEGDPVPGDVLAGALAAVDRTNGDDRLEAEVVSF
jgi:single-strand DNA-binding protein